MLGFHRVRQSRGWTISSRLGGVFISFAGKIYLVHIALGPFTVSWERPRKQG